MLFLRLSTNEGNKMNFLRMLWFCAIKKQHKYGPTLTGGVNQYYKRCKLCDGTRPVKRRARKA